MSARKRVFSGIQPTGSIHVGIYLGALVQWVRDQDVHDNVFCIVDLHAITIPENVTPELLRAKIRELAALYIACGIDPERSAIFVQSHITAHAELTWILNCLTPVGWLERMTQYKEKSGDLESVSTGLLDYPVLMASDILLYRTDLVPVGDDQKQHVELTRDIAQRFNRLYGEVFVVPEPVIPKTGARVMGLDDPDSKMSKSVMERKQGHAIGLLDPPDVIRRSVARAVTDSGNEVRFDHATPGVRNLLEIYEVMSGEPRQAIESRFAGKGYGVLKRDVAEVVVATLDPIQTRYRELLGDASHLEKILADGADRVRPIAEHTLRAAKSAIGVG